MCPHTALAAAVAAIEHDRGKLTPAFRKDHGPPKSWSANRFNLKRLRSRKRAASSTAPIEARWLLGRSFTEDFAFGGVWAEQAAVPTTE
jgi:hypothetical protein